MWAEVYLHAFSGTTLDGDVPLTSNSVGELSAKRTTDRQCIRGMAWQSDGTDWTIESCLAQLWVTNRFRTHRRLVNIDSELRRLQTKSPYIFGLYCSAVCGEKDRVVCYLMQFYITSSSSTTGCIQEYIQLSRIFKKAEVCIPFRTILSLW
jgi:hypothetical protein